MKEHGGITNSIQQLAKAFSKNPHMFLTEADVQCYLYTLLYKRYGRLQKATLTRKQDEYQKKKRSTTRLHAEVTKRGSRKFVDLAVIPQKDILLTPAKPRKIDHLPEKLLTTHHYELDQNNSIGIEIKFNWGHWRTGMNKKKWGKFWKWLIRDIDKLKRTEYRNRYFVFVDKACVFESDTKFRDRFREYLGKKYKNRDWKPYTMYYLTPNSRMDSKRRVHPIRIGKR